MKLRIYRWIGFASLVAFVGVSLITGELSGPTRSGWLLLRREDQPFGFYISLVVWVAVILGLWIVASHVLKKREEIPNYPWKKKPIQAPETTRGK